MTTSLQGAPAPTGAGTNPAPAAPRPREDLVRPNPLLDCLVELCRLGVSPFPCVTLPFRPAPEPPDAQGIYPPLVGLNQHLTT